MSDALDKDELPSWWAMPTPIGQVGVNTTTEQKRKLGLQSLDTGADFTPVVGEIKSIKEGFEDFSEGNIGMGMLGLAGGLPLALGYGPRVAKSVLKSGGNLGNQVAANMPTLVEGFYNGNPYFSFLRDALGEVPSAIKARTSAPLRASERVTGIPSTKLDDIDNQSKVAKRMQNKAKSNQKMAKVANAVGLNKVRKKLTETAEELLRKSKISGEVQPYSLWLKGELFGTALIS